MNWPAFHRRGDVLRTVIEVANRRRDGRLPMDVDGVAETFRDELDLIATLQLRWHSQLAGQIEHALSAEPVDLAAAAVDAWRRTATRMPGVRRILDAQAEAPSNPTVARAMATATAKEHQLLALAAGLASSPEPDARGVRSGAALERRARATLAEPPVKASLPMPSRTLLARLIAALAA